MHRRGKSERQQRPKTCLQAVPADSGSLQNCPAGGHCALKSLFLKPAAPILRRSRSGPSLQAGRTLRRQVRGLNKCRMLVGPRSRGHRARVRPTRVWVLAAKLLPARLSLWRAPSRSAGLKVFRRCPRGGINHNDVTSSAPSINLWVCSCSCPKQDAACSQVPRHPVGPSRIIGRGK
jgi:hypothetical protein